MHRSRQPAHRLQWWQGLVARAVLLAALAVALVVALVIVYGYVETRRSASRAVMTQMAAVAQAREQEITRWIETQRDTLNVVAGSATARRWAQALELGTPADADEDAQAELHAAYEDFLHLLTSVTREQPGVREAMALRAPDGVIVLSSNAARQGEVRGAEVYYMQGLKAQYLGKAETLSTTGRTRMMIAAPLYSGSGTAVAVLAMELDVDWVQRTMLSREAFDPTWERYVVDRSFRLIVGPGAGQTQRPALWDEAVSLIRSGGQSQAGGVGTGIYRNYRNDRVIGAYRWIRATDLALVIEADLGAVVKTGRSWLAWAGPLAVGSVLTGLLSAIILLLHANVAGPLKDLHERVTLVAGGGLAAAAPGTTGGPSKVGEVRELGDAFTAMVEALEDRYQVLETSVAARTEELRHRSLQLQAAAGVSSAVASIRDVHELLDEMVRLLPHYYDFDHVGIFLKVDSGESVVLRATSSEGGRRMLARGHRLSLGQGIVGAVAQEARARIALDVGEDPVFFSNPDLPNTRSEMALPLIVRDQRRYAGTAVEERVRVLGVLDVQSNRSSAFTDEDVTVFQSVADQVALAIENARLLSETDQILRELQVRYGEQVISAWERPLMRIGAAYRYTGSDVVALAGPLDGFAVAPAAQFAEHQDSGQTRSGGRELLAPIVVRGETLGSIALQQGVDGASWDEETLNLVDTVCSQIGEALENARLLDEAQVRAGYEQLTGNITERIRASAADVDEVLRTTLRELGAALGATGSISVTPIHRATSTPEAGATVGGEVNRQGNGGGTR